ncbi:MAG: AgmX/PglI C-terminal domain-containing protein [Sorangiineae bacterium]|nr:AgmX/PglI C-terminal domain-containing protein [Polyangiaceae bacterium]MEB2322348.1 AgmX/PglI C-terminal domain-containing protein [Sorangiineae bacterium]
MRVCTLTNLATALALAVAIAVPACGAGSSQAPAESPPGSSPPAVDAPSPGTTGDAPAPSAELASDAPSGETAAPVASSATPAGSAAPAGDAKRTELVAAIIKEHRDAFRACYDEGRKAIPSLEGNLVLEFQLDGTGALKSAKLNEQRSDITAPKVVECALGVLKGLKFPPHPRGMDSTINYPFNFRPR